MSTTLSNSTTRCATQPGRKTSVPDWWREPLLHFVVLGGLLFAADHVLVGRTSDPRTIVVDAQVDNEARQLFKTSRGREPNEDELYALRRIWLDNEVLYREGLVLQVDRGDKAIRERVIFKALSVVDANVKLPPFDENLLREWFEAHRARYDEPARFDFQEAVLAGDTSESEIRAFVDALNAGAPGDAKAGLRVFKGRPHPNLVQSYGAEFAKALAEAAAGEWRALPTHDGLRAMRLEAITSPKPAAFERLRGVVLQDWTDTVMADQRTAAVRALARKYTVKVEGAAK
jgi:PPIC-type PPIASE domain